jgi:hypothetical protein
LFTVITKSEVRGGQQWRLEERKKCLNFPNLSCSNILLLFFSGTTQQNDVLSLYLEAVYVLVSSLSVAIRQQKDFIDVLWYEYDEILDDLRISTSRVERYLSFV